MPRLVKLSIDTFVTLALNPPLVPTGDGSVQPVQIEGEHIILERRKLYLNATITSFKDAVESTSILDTAVSTANCS